MSPGFEAAVESHWSTRAVRQLEIWEEGEESRTTTFGEWAADNASTPELVAEVDALLPGQFAVFGGGAAPAVLIGMVGR